MIILYTFIILRNEIELSILYFCDFTYKNNSSYVHYFIYLFFFWIELNFVIIISKF